MVLAARLDWASKIFGVNTTYFVHQNQEGFHWEYFVVFDHILRIDRFYEEPKLLVKGLGILLEQTLVDPEIGRLDQTLEKCGMQLLFRLILLFILELVSNFCKNIDGLNIDEYFLFDVFRRFS